MPLRIEDYGLIGDTQAAALVGCDGAIDWLCLPHFDSGACFAALLGEPRHGRWLLAPASPVRATRRQYRPETLILETDVESDSGTVRLTDFMTPRSHEPDLIRIVEGLRGDVAIQMELNPRGDWLSCLRPLQRNRTRRRPGHRTPYLGCRTRPDCDEQLC